MIDALDHALGTLNQVLINLFAAIIGAIAVLIPLNLFMIRMQWGAIWWLHEAVEYALYIGVFLAAPWVLRKGAHIKADVISAHLPQNVAIVLDRIISLIGAAICAVLFYYAIRSAIAEYQYQSYPPKDLRIANWYMMAIFAVSFFLCTIEFLLSLRRRPQFLEEAEDMTKKAGM